MRTNKPSKTPRLLAAFLPLIAFAFSANAAHAQRKTNVVRPSSRLPATPVMEKVESSNDASTLTVYTEFEPRDWYFHRVFLDTDNNPATGFSVGTIQNGAEFLVEGAFLYRYTGTGRNWSWQPLASVPFELGARSVHAGSGFVGWAFCPPLQCVRAISKQSDQ